MIVAGEKRPRFCFQSTFLSVLPTTPGPPRSDHLESMREVFAPPKPGTKHEGRRSSNPPVRLTSLASPASVMRRMSNSGTSMMEVTKEKPWKPSSQYQVSRPGVATVCCCCGPRSQMPSHSLRPRPPPPQERQIRYGIYDSQSHGASSAASAGRSIAPLIHFKMPLR